MHVNILCRYDLHIHDSFLVSDELTLNKNIAPVVPLFTREALDHSSFIDQPANISK